MKIFLTTALTLSLALLTSCKPNQSSDDLGVQSQAAQKQQQNYFPSPYDLQEFYSIIKEFYFNKLKTTAPESFGVTEKDLMKKFYIKPEEPSQTRVYAETMFELLESGLYEQKIHGIQRPNRLTRSAPKGLSNRDLQDFFQVVKMEYFKRITNRQAPQMVARESGFYERARNKAAEAKSGSDDILLIASDLFDKLEGIK